MHVNHCKKIDRTTDLQLQLQSGIARLLPIAEGALGVEMLRTTWELDERNFNDRGQSRYKNPDFQRYVSTARCRTTREEMSSADTPNSLKKTIFSAAALVGGSGNARGSGLIGK